MEVLTLENRISVLILFLSELKATLLCTAPATESFCAELGVVANKEKYIHVPIQIKIKSIFAESVLDYP